MSTKVSIHGQYCWLLEYLAAASKKARGAALGRVYYIAVNGHYYATMKQNAHWSGDH